MELSPMIYNHFIRPSWYNQRFITNILKEKYNFDDKKVLDFGCGVGSNCFLAKPINYLGVDPNKKRIEYAKYNNPQYQFEVLEDSINATPNSFDIILIIAVLHHIPNNKISTIIKELQTVLKSSSGIIMVLEPCFFDKNLLSNYYMKLFDKGQYIRKQKEYLKIFENHNFIINDVKKISKLAYKELFFTASQV